MKEMDVLANHAVPFSKATLGGDNRWLTQGVSDDENFQASHQISPLKTLGSDGMHVIFLP